jgi:hypothetical protein
MAAVTQARTAKVAKVAKVPEVPEVPEAMPAEGMMEGVWDKDSRYSTY